MENLNTIEEWVDYINQIPMIEMISHAKVIGSVSFQEDMESEGYNSDEVMSIYLVLTKKFLEYDIRIPDSMDQSCVNFRELASSIITSD